MLRLHFRACNLQRKSAADAMDATSRVLSHLGPRSVKLESFCGAMSDADGSLFCGAGRVGADNCATNRPVSRDPISIAKDCQLAGCLWLNIPLAGSCATATNETIAALAGVRSRCCVGECARRAKAARSSRIHLRSARLGGLPRRRR